jgi:alkaline phosphatase D
VATEFAGTSVTSEGVPYDVFSRSCRRIRTSGSSRAASAANVLAQATRSLWRTELRIVDTMTKPEATVRTSKAYAVEVGKAGAQEA